MKNIQFLNKLDVCQKLKCSKTSIYNYVNEGILPPAIVIHGKCKWYEYEINEVMRHLAAGKSHDQIKLVVRRQVSDRLASAA